MYILTIDDDTNLGRMLGSHVAQWGYRHLHVSGEDDLHYRGEIAVPAAVLLDIHPGEESGLNLMASLRRRWPGVPVIVISTQATVQSAVKAIRSGAYDYLSKPLDISRLEILLRNAVDHRRATNHLHELETANADGLFGDMVGTSEGMRRVFRTIELSAPTDVPILLLGETGTGKELVARAVHRLSPRCKGPFIPVNCAAMPATLVESTLFGQERGAFTGAFESRNGSCQQANGGTLFLDEIGEMPMEVQPKLLRFLQDHVAVRVGATQGHAVDIRIVAATNREPARAIAARKLREDLFYRLNVISCHLPPLRERHADIPLLSYHFLRLAASRFRRPMNRISPAAMALLQESPWPGNVRQLENLITGIVVEYGNCEELQKHMLDPACHSMAVPEPAGELSMMAETLEEMEKRMLVNALQQTHGGVPDAAVRLGISPATVYRKIKKLGLTAASNV